LCSNDEHVATRHVGHNNKLLYLATASKSSHKRTPTCWATTGSGSTSPITIHQNQASLSNGKFIHHLDRYSTGTVRRAQTTTTGGTMPAPARTNSTTHSSRREDHLTYSVGTLMKVQTGGRKKGLSRSIKANPTEPPSTTSAVPVLRRTDGATHSPPPNRAGPPDPASSPHHSVPLHKKGRTRTRRTARRRRRPSVDPKARSPNGHWRAETAKRGKTW